MKPQHRMSKISRRAVIAGSVAGTVALTGAPALAQRCPLKPAPRERGLETPEFQRQSRDFAAALTKLGKPVQLIAAPGHNHFEMGESLGNPYGIMGRAALAMMGLTAAV